MRKFEDLTGMVFGRLTVKEKLDSKRNIQWLCVCECGNEHIATSGNLKSGAVRSCGCLNKERSRAQLFVHGDTHSRLYRIWASMRRRCYEKSNKDYKNYGGRGVTVCEEWMEYMQFKSWAVENGYSEDLSIDRIDVNGNYTPENCRWVDAKTQCNNRRNNHQITYNGKTLTISQWSDLTKIPPKTIRYRIVSGWSVEDALTTTPNRSNRLAKPL